MSEGIIFSIFMKPNFMIEVTYDIREYSCLSYHPYFFILFGLFVFYIWHSQA